MKKSSSHCPAQALLELLGRQHMLTIIHTLGTTECGFSELQKKTGVNTRTLTKRLQELQDEKLAMAHEISDGRCKNYQLTKKGLHVHDVLQQLHN